MRQILVVLVLLCPVYAWAQSTLIQGIDVNGVKRTIRTDTSGALAPNSTASTGGGFAAVAVTNAAGGTIVGALSGRRTIIIQNLGPNALYCGASLAGVTAPTTAIALKLPAGGERSYDIATGLVLRCIAETALQVAPADTRYQEIG